MDAASLAFSVAQTLLAALQLPEVKEILSICGYESKLDSLQSSVTFINAVLQDADAKEQQGHKLSQQELCFLERLKDVVYDADDLFDDFITRAQQEHLPDSSKKQVSGFLSTSFKRFGVAFKMSREVKMIKEKLDEIANDATKFGFKGDYHQPISLRKPRDITDSFLLPATVIGREDDKMEIINMLLDTNVVGDIFLVDASTFFSLHGIVSFTLN